MLENEKDWEAIERAVERSLVSPQLTQGALKIMEDFQQCLIERRRLADFNNNLEKDIERLKRGAFTPEEFQNLCHNFNDHDYKVFCDGCDDYQKKLFNKCRSEE